MMHTCVSPRYTVSEKLLLGSLKIFTKPAEWIIRKLADKMQKFENAFFDWD
jgi:hypothetical protein